MVWSFWYIYQEEIVKTADVDGEGTAEFVKKIFLNLLMIFDPPNFDLKKNVLA